MSEQAIADPTRAGTTRLQYLAGVLGLPHDADAEAVATKAIEFQVKLEEQFLDVGRELRESAEGNLKVLSAFNKLLDGVERLRNLAPSPEGATPEQVLGAVELKLRSDLADSVLGQGVGRLVVIDTKAREKPGLMEACYLMARLHQQVVGKNPRISKDAYDVSLPAKDAAMIPSLLVGLKDLEAVCIKSDAVNPDMSDART